jgi:predicted MPP superfamily phosphohydrolase
MATIKVPYRISELDIDNICYTDIKVNNKKTIVYMKYSDNNKLKNIVFQTPTFMSTNLIQVKNNMYELDVPLIGKEEHKIDKFISKIPSGINEICILAGDIGNPYQKNYDIFMDFISKNFKKTFYITGNHEYYNKTKTIQETNEFLEDYFQQFNNISFLNNNYEIYDNYCFIGTTLWSKIVNPTYEINDIYSIRTMKPTFFTYDNTSNNNTYQCENSITGNSAFKYCGPAAYYEIPKF